MSCALDRLDPKQIWTCPSSLKTAHRLIAATLRGGGLSAETAPYPRKPRSAARRQATAADHYGWRGPRSGHAGPAAAFRPGSRFRPTPRRAGSTSAPVRAARSRPPGRSRPRRPSTLLQQVGAAPHRPWQAASGQPTRHTTAGQRAAQADHPSHRQIRRTTQGLRGDQAAKAMAHQRLHAGRAQAGDQLRHCLRRATQDAGVAEQRRSIPALPQPTRQWQQPKRGIPDAVHQQDIGQRSATGVC